MCNHKYSFSSEVINCEWDTFYLNILRFEKEITFSYKNLPHDKSGKCIFHSLDLEWKREHHFFERLQELIFLLNFSSKHENIRFIDCHFVGYKTDEIQEDILSDEQLDIAVKNKNSQYLIDFCSKISNKEILLYNCTFHDAVTLYKCYLKEGIHIESCLFHKRVEVSKNRINGDVSITDKTCFKSGLRFVYQNIINDVFQISKCVFEGNVDFDNAIFRANCYIEDSEFKSKNNYCNFSCNFSTGIYFRRNNIIPLLNFSECYFGGDSIFEDFYFKSELHFEVPEIAGSIVFRGKESQLLFENGLTVFNLSENNFYEKSNVRFEFCNILKLGSEFLDNCKELENLQLVSIATSCKIDRLSIRIEFSYENLKAYLIEDLSLIVTRYFEYYHSINLRIDIEKRRSDGLFVIIFKTSDKIKVEDFMNKLNHFPNKLKDSRFSTPIKSDLISSLFNLLQRCQNQGNISLNEILTLNQNINIENYNNMKIKKIENKGQLFIAEHQNIENLNINTINEEKLLEEIDNMLTQLNQASDSKSEQSAEKLKQAQESIKKGNLERAIFLIKSIGKWGVKIAENIGANIIASIILQ